MAGKVTVRTPVEGYCGEVAGVSFVDGAAEVDEDHRSLAYFGRHGYTIETEADSGDDEAAPDGDDADQADGGDDVPSGSIADVLAWVDGDPDRARAALQAEQARGDRARTGLIEPLTQLAATAGSDTAHGSEPDSE